MKNNGWGDAKNTNTTACFREKKKKIFTNTYITSFREKCKVDVKEFSSCSRGLFGLGLMKEFKFEPFFRHTVFANCFYDILHLYLCLSSMFLLKWRIYKRRKEIVKMQYAKEIYLIKWLDFNIFHSVAILIRR